MSTQDIPYGDIPIFTEKDFFTDNENVHIQRSDELEEFVGVMHKHRFIEIVYVVSGKAIHEIDGKSYPVEKGDISVITRLKTHRFCANKNYNEKFVAYDLMFTPDFLDTASFIDEDFMSLSNSFLFKSLFPDDEGFIENFNLIKNCDLELGVIFEKLYLEYKKRRTGYLSLMRTYIVEIIVKMFRIIELTEQPWLSETQKRMINSTIRYIKYNYSSPIKMDDISKNLFFSKNYIGKIFKKAMGMSISEYITQTRLNEVCRLLSETEESISDIITKCGYNDTKSFYTAFRKYTGYTPKKYRKRKYEHNI